MNARKAGVVMGWVVAVELVCELEIGSDGGEAIGGA